MKRAEKVESVASLRGDLERATVAVVADFRGLKAGQFDQLRRTVRGINGRCRVTKNRLTKRAIEGTAYAHLDGLLEGPTALLLGFDDPVAVAKAVVAFSKEQRALEIRGGGLQATPLPGPEVTALAELPPREVLLAQLLGVLQAPATQLVRLLNEPATRLARLLKAMAERGDAPAAD